MVEINLQSASDALDSLKEKSEEAEKALAWLKEEAKTSPLAAIFSDAVDGAKAFIDATSKSSDELAVLNDEHSKTIGFLSAGLTAYFNLDKAILGVANSASIGQKSLASLNETIKTYNEIVSKINPSLKIEGAAAAALSANAKIKGDQESLLNTISQYGGIKLFTGDSGSELEQKEEQIKRLPALLLDVQNKFGEISKETNLNPAVIAEFGKEVMQIPGAFNALVPAVDKSGAQMNVWEQALKITRGTTGDTKQAIKAITYEFENFGKVTEKSNQYQAQFYSASTILGVQTSLVADKVTALGSEFAMLGDNTEGITSVFTAMTGALEKTGLGFNQASKLSMDFLTNVKNATDAQLAFISAQTGGKGGLAGATELRAKMESGPEGLKEVTSKFIEATNKGLRQVGGGEIVTTQEAATGGYAQQAANKAQREMLMSGQFGVKAKDEAEASRFLKLLNEGNLQQMLSDVSEKVKEAPEEALKLGKEVKDQQYDVMNSEIAEMTVTAATVAITGQVTIDEALKDFTAEKIRQDEESVKKIRTEPKATSIDDIRSGQAAINATKDLEDLAKETIKNTKKVLDEALSNVKDKQSAEISQQRDQSVINANREVVVGQVKEIREQKETATTQQPNQQNIPVVTLLIKREGSSSTTPVIVTGINSEVKIQ